MKIKKDRILEILLVTFFFVNLLFVGLFIYKDYGISWDEPINRENGQLSYNYVFNGNKSLFLYTFNNLGTAFEMPLFFAEKIFNIKDSRDIFLMRHLLTFLFCFIGVFFFFLLCKKIFKNWKIGLLGSFFLVLSPRIFSNFFYNSKDAVFLSAFIIGIYSLLNFLEKKSYKSAFLHAIISGFLIDVRIVGLILPLLTFLVFIPSIIKKKSILKKDIILLVFYLLIMSGLIILLWPWLWQNPLNFLDALTRIKSGNSVPLYFGKYLQSSEIPWHYIPVWMGITIQPVYLLLFFVGLYWNIKSALKNRGSLLKNKNIHNSLVILWFFIPLILFYLTKSVPYDSWRHLFFIYPSMIIFVLQGILEITKVIKKIKRRYIKKGLFILLICILVITFLITCRFMIINHPNEEVYFNVFAGNKENIKNNFDMDYWGLSYRQALEYILREDNRTKINIVVENMPGVYNSYILYKNERSRLNYVKNPADADYLLTEYRWHNKDYSYPKVYSIKVEGMEIMTVYRVTH